MGVLDRILGAAPGIVAKGMAGQRAGEDRRRKQLIEDEERSQQSQREALQRMLLKGWVSAKWGVTDGNRRARYYRIMKAGFLQLSDEIVEFERVFTAIRRVIKAV